MGGVIKWRREIFAFKNFQTFCTESSIGPAKNLRSERGVLCFIWSEMMETISGINKPRVSFVLSQTQTPCLLLALEFLLGHITTVWSWASDWTSLCHTFLICKIEPIIMPLFQGCYETQWGKTDKARKWCLAHSQCSINIRCKSCHIKNAEQ